MSVYQDILDKAHKASANGNGKTPPAPPPPILEPVNRLALVKDVPDDSPLEGVAEWPAPLGPAARLGLMGALLATIGPETEADDAALALHLLVFFGSCIGRAAHCAVGG